MSNGKKQNILEKIKTSVPSIIGWGSIFAGSYSIIEFLLKHHDIQIITKISHILALFNIIHGQSIFTAFLMLILGACAFRRKKITVWLFVITQISYITLWALIIGISILDHSIKYLLKNEITYITTNLTWTILVLVVIIWAKNEFPSKINKKSLKIGLLIFFIGELALMIFSIIFQAVVYGKDQNLSDAILWFIALALGNRGIPLPIIGREIFNNSFVTYFISISSAIITLIALRSFLLTNIRVNRTADQDLQLHKLLAKYPTDSLAYFSTNNNRGIIFSNNKQAAITYTIASGVALAGGDPIGNRENWNNAIQNWIEFTHKEGLVPAALSTTENGARAYKKSGFIIKALGDEAIIDVPFFSVGNKNMKGLNAAKKRTLKAGITIQCRRLCKIDEKELCYLKNKAAEYRNGDERGFSMASDRILHSIDFDQMVVTAYDANKNLQALLTFAPWGTKGLSLNQMRRKPDSVNGVIEAMILSLINIAREENIEKISLNFATFRHLIVEGNAVDANFIKRIMRRIIIIASRVWQLQSLYESNAKYQPTWQTRYIAFKPGRLISTIIASAQLEGFLPFGYNDKRITPKWISSEQHRNVVKKIYDDNIKSTVNTRKLTEQQKICYKKAHELAEKGMQLYPVASCEKTNNICELIDEKEKYLSKKVIVHARIKTLRKHGSIIFIDIHNQTQKIQCVAIKNKTENYELIKYTSIGDIIAVKGVIQYTKTGEYSIFMTSWNMLSKILRPIINTKNVLDKKIVTRNRTMQLMTQNRNLQILRMRFKAVTQIRHILEKENFTEVETPMLHAIKGGANAKPFITHLNAYNYQVNLRIAPELYLKRLAIAGMDAIFEIGRSFRNEGVDNTHNPEFTSLEAYKANADYNTMMKITEKLIKETAKKIHGRYIIWQPLNIVKKFEENSSETQLQYSEKIFHIKADEIQKNEIWKTQDEHQSYVDAYENAEEKMVEVDISKPWRVITVLEAVSKAVNTKITMGTEKNVLQKICEKHKINVDEDATVAQMINEIYDKLVEPNTSYPTFYIDFPKETSPLTRQHRENKQLAERWDLVAFGMEIATAYSELTDPIDQRERFIEQSLAAAYGDPEAMSVDTDFLNDMELALTPTGGMGMGIDRMAMLLCGTNIREIIAFPFVKPIKNTARK